MNKASLIGISCLLLINCGSPGKLKKTASPLDSSGLSFAVVTNPEEHQDGVIVSIENSSLEKKFLLAASVSEYFTVSQFSGLQTRVVKFKDIGTRVILVEDMGPYTAHRKAEDEALLVSFPIINRTDKSIGIDFNAGFSNLFVAGEWYTSDISGKQVNPTWNQVELQVSYLKKAEMKGNTAIIEQIARSDSMPIRAVYYLSPYQANPEFKPTKAPDFHHVGFFETTPQFLENGQPTTFATKFDKGKGINFFLSANTPQKWRQPIIDGILYWNRAFGEDILSVEMAPENTRAPNFSHNLIQWVDYDLASFAYADAQMDPFNGEIRHAQVFFPSSWAIAGANAARKQLGRLKNTSSGIRKLAIKGLQTSLRCQYKFSTGFQQILGRLVLSQTDEDTYSRVSRDYIREVIAHEIGHTLGLRHNFAGTTNNHENHEHRDELLEQYLNQTLDSAPVLSSSVMDYHPFVESLLIGKAISEGNAALAYDRKAIQVLYEGKAPEAEPKLTFCTDSSIALDCQKFDYGKSPIAFFYNEGKAFRRDAAFKILQGFIDAKAPLFEPPIPLQNVPFSIATFAKSLHLHKWEILEALNSKTYLEIQKKYPFFTDLTEEKILQETYIRHSQDLASVGGIEKILAKSKDDEILKIKANFLELLNKNRSGVGPGGSYLFSDTDIRFMENFIEEAIDKLLQISTKIEIQGLNTFANALPDHQIFDDLSSVYSKRATDILLNTQPAEKNLTYTFTYTNYEGTSEAMNITVPKFRFDKETRIAAINLFSSNRGKGLSWRFLEKDKKQAYQALTKLVKKSIEGLDLGKVDLTQVPKKLGHWIINNRQILQAMGISPIITIKKPQQKDDEEKTENEAKKSILRELVIIRNLRSFYNPTTSEQWQAFIQ